ncbi:MAG: T4 family baseplate hub assembly chaperone [Candidatus Thorarchaeota archaeon]|jgi:hypothetical protein
MPDDNYRPQKQSVKPSEISGQNPQQEQLEQMSQVSDADLPSPKLGVPQEGGMKLEGNIPSQFTDALAANSQEQPPQSQQPQQPQQPQQFKGPRPNPAPPVPRLDLRATGSSKMEQLLQEIAHSTSVYEAIELPSKGKFYDGQDGPTDGIIHMRSMTGEEEAVLATPRLVKDGKAIDMIFNRCVQEQYDTANFLVQDRTYMLIYLRIISYTEEYEVELRCPETDKPFSYTIDLNNNLFMDYCPDDFDSSSLSGHLPNTGFSFSYSLARGRDDKRLNDYRNHKIKHFETSNQPDDSLSYKTAQLVNEIEGVSDKQEIHTLIKKLPINDVSFLRTLVNEPPFGMDTKITISSPFTMSEFEVELPLEANFFFPKTRKKDTQ